MSKLNAKQVKQSLAKLPGWKQVGDEIVKTFAFEDYYETMAFVNAAAWVSHREDHHPDMEVGYNKCKVRYSTHSEGGITKKDVACAQKLEALMKI